MLPFLGELWRFVRARRKYWLAPVLILFLIFGSLLIATKGSVLAPFIYTVF